MNKYRSKNTPEVVQQMRKMAEEGYALQYLARKFNCQPNAVLHRVYDVIPARKATTVQKKKYLERSKLTVDDVNKIRSLAVKSGINAVELGRMYGVSQTTALSVVNGKTFRWVPGMTLKGLIRPIDYDPKFKTDRTRGAKTGTKQAVKSGVLKKYAKIHGVSASTICKWLKSGKLKAKKNECFHY